MVKRNGARHRRLRNKKTQNRLSMFLVSLVVIMLMVVVAIRSMGLQEKSEEKDAQIAALEQKMTDEEKRKEKIEEYEKYTKTIGFMQEQAEKQGFVYEGDTVFVEE